MTDRPWLVLSLLSPALGAIWVKFAREPDAARRRSLIASGLALAFALLAWGGFMISTPRGIPEPTMALDDLSAPLLPLAALIYFLTNLATLRAKVREFSFARSLASEAILLATLGGSWPWGVVLPLAAGVLPPYWELRRGRKPTRVYVVHMALFVALLVSGQALLDWDGGRSPIATTGVIALTMAMLLRSGVVPVHCWMTDLFEHATFGTALLFVTPMAGAYGMARLVLPMAPRWVLEAISLASLATAAYAAGMALAQREGRRFFCYLFLSHSSLVLSGLAMATPLGLTAALCLWLSVALSLTGFGLTLRCVEARAGRVSLTEFHGLHQHVPTLAALFALTGLASVGFPGTVGFVGLELLVDGAVRSQPLKGAAVVVVAALNGLAVMHAYFRVFAGRPHAASIDMRVRPAERASVLVLTVLILGGGLYPQPGVTMLHRAAVRLAAPRGVPAHVEARPISGPIARDSAVSP